MRLMHEVGDVILHDPDVAGLRLVHRQHRQRAIPPIPAAIFIVLKPRDERNAQLLADHRPAAAASSPRSQGVNLFLQPTQDINVGGRIARGSFQYTLQDTNIDELNEWSQKLLEKLRTLPQLADVTSDLLANAPQLKITINRDQAARFGISPQADRRHAQRRLRPAPDHAVFHPAQDLLRGPGNPARAAEGPRRRSTGFTSNRR